MALLKLKRIRKQRTVVSSLLLTAIVLVMGSFRKNEETEGRIRNLSVTGQMEINSTNGNAGAPVIKTFFQPLHTDGDFDMKQNEMLTLWAEEWNMAGFQTQILTLENARIHPYFEEMKKVVEEKLPGDPYNHYCFYRYLAMATSGGGWHVDYDTMPSNFPLELAQILPYHGAFVSYHWPVPALISASEEEWTRIGQLITEQTHKTSNPHPSDMNMIKDLLQENEGIHDIIFKPASANYVTKPPFILNSKEEVNCDLMQFALVTHFSHYGMDLLFKENKFPIAVETPNEHGSRERGIKKIQDMFREQCRPIPSTFRTG